MKRRAFQVVDLGFGDSGKGTMVDYLTARHDADLIVRFNGGPQAGHNVVLPDGRHHTFAQFGSGMFLPRVRTLLSRFMLIEPYAMRNEAEHLATVGISDALSRTFVDARCRVITPPQQIANRVRERARGPARHGTCGMGIGECMSDSVSQPDITLYAADLTERTTVRQKLQKHLESKRSSLNSIYSYAANEDRFVFENTSWIDRAVELYREIAEQVTIFSAAQTDEIIRSSKSIIFEGAQGVLLDESFGFQPNTTWSTTTFQNADVLLNEAGADVDRYRIGVIRSYMTRHGPGAFVTERRHLDCLLPESHNANDGWPGKFRLGVLDLVILRYAIAACGGVDTLALTCLDRLPQLPAKVCESYELDGTIVRSGIDIAELGEISGQVLHAKPHYQYVPNKPEAFVAAVESGLKVSVKYLSSGITRLDKEESLRNRREISIPIEE